MKRQTLSDNKGKRSSGFSVCRKCSRYLLSLCYRAICPTANSIAHITRHIIPMKNKYMPMVDAGDGTGRTQRNIPIMMNTIARISKGCISFLFPPPVSFVRL